MLRKMQTRSLLLGAMFTLLFFWLIGRLYWMQIVQSSWLVSKAEEMWGTNYRIPSERGTIYDRNMKVLAGDATGYNIVLNPRLINELGLADEVADGLSEVLGASRQFLLEQATSKDGDGNYRIYRLTGNEGRKVNEETAQAVSAWKDAFVAMHGITGTDWPGVTLEKERIRVYPLGAIGAHVIGFINKNGQAASGLELTMDETLRGTDGFISYEKDRLGRKLPGSKPDLIRPVDGKSLVLTIDQVIQHYAETALRNSYEMYKPKNMTAIVVDPKSMELLALANAPSYDPNEYWKYDPDADFRNMAIQSRYEPGSTFKLVTLAAAVDQDVFDPNETYMSGSVVVGGERLSDHRRSGWGEITYLEGLLRSSNVAFVKLGYERLGKETLEQYIQKFGFTRKTGIDLPGEVSGLLNLRYPVETATATYGQGGIVVTPIQQLAAFAAIANDGKLMEPFVVKKIIDSNTKEVLEEKRPREVAQVISPEAARQVSNYLTQVVSDDRGTGRRARLDPYTVAGKSGTANIVVDGTYSKDTWVVSFIGYAPADDPRIAVAVIADQPDLGGDSNRAGQVAGTVFKEIVSQTLSYLGVEPDRGFLADAGTDVISESGTRTLVPDVVGLITNAAEREIGARGLPARVIGNGAKVASQYPAAGEKVAGAPVVFLFTEASEEVAVVPNVAGISLRDALHVCSLLELQCKLEGEGYVVEQETVETETGLALRLRLEPLGEAGFSEKL